MTRDLRVTIIAYRLHTSCTNIEYKIFTRYFSYDKIRLRLVTDVTSASFITRLRISRTVIFIFHLK